MSNKEQTKQDIIDKHKQKLEDHKEAFQNIALADFEDDQKLIGAHNKGNNIIYCMCDIDIDYQRGDIVKRKSEEERVDDNIPLPEQFEIISVMIPQSHPDGQIKYESPFGDFVCAKLVDRNYKLIESTSE